MAGMGHSLPKRDVRATSAFHLIATTWQTRRHVAKVPHPEMLVSRLGHRMRPPLLFHCARAIKYARSRISASEIGCVTSAIEASYPGRVLLLYSRRALTRLCLS